MSFENVKSYFKAAGLEEKVMQLEKSSATVIEAAEALGCQEKQIAKTLSFLIDDEPVLIVLAGDAKVDNKKYKEAFSQKAKMIPAERVEEYTGHTPGGVCPFAVKPGVKVYLDISLKRFDSVFPAAGSSCSSVHLSLAELEKHSNSAGWVDVCKDWS